MNVRGTDIYTKEIEISIKITTEDTEGDYRRRGRRGCFGERRRRILASGRVASFRTGRVVNPTTIQFECICLATAYFIINN